MSEPKIGRLVVASLHQAIAERLPLRLDFYENWLKPLGLLKEGRTIGVASFTAALSFLRREDPPSTYAEVTRRAGVLAAEWAFDDMGWPRRRWNRMLPLRWRMRSALVMTGRVARAAYPGSRVNSKIRRNAALIEVRSSIFCQVREAVDLPLCGFYEGLLLRLLAEYGLEGRLRIVKCRASGGQTCDLELAEVVEADAPLAEAAS
jgi:hypothetical protein